MTRSAGTSAGGAPAATAGVPGDGVHARHTAGPVAAFVALGFASLIAQALYLREFLAISFGNELTLGVALAFWLTGIVGGALASGRSARHRSSAGAFVVVIWVLALLGPAELLLIRSARVILQIQPGEVSSLFQTSVAALMGVLPFGAAVGWAFPVAARLARDRLEQDRPGWAIGKVYVLEAAGALLGGIVFTFVLIPTSTATEIVVASAVILSVGGVLLCRMAAVRPWIRAASVCLALVFIFSAITPLSGALERLGDHLRWQGVNPSMKHLASVDSRYQHIDIGEIAGQLSLYANGQYVLSFPDEYSFAPIAHLVMSVLPEWDHPRILLLGGAGSGLLDTIVKYDTGPITLVELDGVLLGTVEAFQDDAHRDVLRDRRVRTVTMDARRFIKETDQTFDLILLTLPEPSNAMLNRFYTVEFFSQCRRVLADKGIFSLRAGAGMNYYGADSLRYTASVYRSLTSVFQDVEAVPLESAQFFAARERGLIELSLGTLAARFNSRWHGGGPFTAEHMSALVEPERIAFFEREIRSVPSPKRNTDGRPVAYFFNLLLWERMLGGPGGKVLGWARTAGWGLFAAALALWGIAAAAVTRRRRGAPAGSWHRTALLAMVATGLCGMAWDIILLYAFQATFGYLYQWVGFIVALFMCGLALGGAAGTAFLAAGHGRRLVLAADVALGAFSMLLALVLARADLGFIPGASESLRRAVFLAMVVGAGALTGFPFPLVAGVLAAEKREVGGTAAAVDAADHGGAVAGAALTGVIMVPLYGVTATLAFLAGLKAVTASLLWIRGAGGRGNTDSGG